MGTTDAHKMFTRLRRAGYLYEADKPKGHINVPNRSGQSCFRAHLWTGKRPPYELRIRCAKAGHDPMERIGPISLGLLGLVVVGGQLAILIWGTR